MPEMLAARFALAILLGVLLAVPYVVYAHRARRSGVLFGLGLTIVALLYVGFAAVGGGGSQSLLLEIAGVVLFGAAAVVGIRWFTPLLAAAWAAHVAWDLLLHPVQFSGYAPWWYPVVCIGFDLFVSGFILATYLARPTSDQQPCKRGVV